MEIKNLKKTAQRILKAIKSKEKIILYGDADMDGITSVVILKETLINLGVKPAAIYFPNREKEGYGINETALGNLKKFAPALFITLDCGISNFKETELAKKMGFEVVIIDHHHILDKVPRVSIIVDPNQKGDKYPFKQLANVGIAFKLALLLLKDKMTDSLKNSFLELVMLATIADMMKEEGENKEMISQGLVSLENTRRPGLKAFFEMNGVKDYPSTRQIAQKIISALNITEPNSFSLNTGQSNLTDSYLLLISDSIEEAKILAENLLEKRGQRQKRIKEIVEEIEERILKNIKEFIVFEGDPGWPLILTGAISSQIFYRYQKPIFIFRKEEKESRGSVRMPLNLNAVEAMKSCSDLLLSYGGHPPAAGFTIKNENLERFKTCLIKYFENEKNNYPY